jgi:hypothetical protein
MRIDERSAALAKWVSKVSKTTRIRGLLSLEFLSAVMGFGIVKCLHCDGCNAHFEGKPFCVAARFAPDKKRNLAQLFFSFRTPGGLV